MNIPCTESFCSQKTHNRMLLFGSTPLKHDRHSDYWNQPLNMRMLVWYLYCHEARLCCYLLILIGNLLHPLQLFYFNLWPIYWLCLEIVSNVCREMVSVDYNSYKFAIKLFPQIFKFISLIFSETVVSNCLSKATVRHSSRTERLFVNTVASNGNWQILSLNFQRRFRWHQ
jgi:hypothetical protein